MADRPRNVYMDLFSDAFLAYQRAQGDTDPAPYLIQTKDGVQLATLIRKGQETNWPITIERWERGLKHYFLSDLGERTIADLASRFSTFWKGSLDRYSKPKERASQIGAAEPISYASWHPKFLAMAWKVAQKDKSKFDAIDELFNQVTNLDEIEATRRLKAIERGE